jgi:hypothetical protein
MDHTGCQQSVFRLQGLSTSGVRLVTWTIVYYLLAVSNGALMQNNVVKVPTKVPTPKVPTLPEVIFVRLVDARVVGVEGLDEVADG